MSWMSLDKILTTSKSFSGGKEELNLDASLDDRDSLSITTEHAQLLRQEKHKADDELCEEENPESVHWFDKAIPNTVT